MPRRPRSRPSCSCPRRAAGPGAAAAARPSSCGTAADAADPGLGAGGLRQDDAARGLAGRRCRREADPAIAWVSLDEADRGAAVVLDLRADRPRAGRPRRRRRRPGRCWRPVSRSRPCWPPSSTSSASCPTTWTSCSTTTTSPTARRSSRAWRSCSSTCRRRCAWSSAPAPTRRCRWPGCGRAASSPRSARPTCASPTTRRPPTSTDATGLELAAARRRRAGGADRGLDRLPAAGRALAARPRRPVRRSSPGSPATTGTSWTTSSRRSSTASPSEVRDFLLGTAILDRLTGPLCDAVTETTGQRPDARVAGAAQPVRGAARRPAALVPLPPPVRRRAPRAPARRAARPASPGCTAAPATGTTRPGEPEPAVRHALAAGDVERAAELVELAIPALRRDRREAVLRALGRRPSRRGRPATGRCSPSAWSAA